MATTKENAAAKDLVAKKLRTGEVAVWDGDLKQVIIVAQSQHGPTVRVISGATLKSLEKALGDIVMLV